MPLTAVAQGDVFGDCAHCFILEDGRIMLSWVDASSPVPYDALCEAWRRAMMNHGVDVDVGGVVVRCTEAKRVVDALEELCWGRPPGAPFQLGASRLLRAMSNMGGTITQAFTPWESEALQ